MALTTPALVKQVVSVSAGVDLTPFITLADSIVQAICTQKGPKCTPYPTGPMLTDPLGNPYQSGQLELIERWLTAHYYVVALSRAQAAMEQKKGPFTDRYAQLIFGKGLDQTGYGQAAMDACYFGFLADWNKAIRTGGPPGGAWLGTRFFRDTPIVWPGIPPLVGF